MTNSELKEYAAANRSRLKKQKVALGDWVMILVGRFAGINGVIKGISVCGNDFTDPYYEVDMACEVPDKYKCRKTLIQPNNVIGGFSASDFEVICSRTPESDIKEAEPKPKLRVGDRVKTSEGEGIVGSVSTDGKYVVVRIDGGDLYCVDVTKKEQQPTAEEGKKKLQSRLDDADSASSILTILREETVPTTAWQSYRMELAAKIAVAYAEKGRYEPEEIGAKAVEVANGVVERLKNGKV